MFNPKELQDLAKSTIKQLWGWFSDLGTFMSGILGFYIIFRLAKYILGVIINGFHLYRTFGGGIKLLACVWNTLTMWLIHRYHSERPRRATSQPDVEAVLVEPAIPLTHFDDSSFMPRPSPRRNHQLAKSQPNLYENMQPPHPSKKFSSCSTTTLVQPYSLIPSAPHWAETVEEN